MTTTPTLIHIAMAITHTLIVIMVLDGGARVTGDMGDGVIMVIEVRVTGVMVGEVIMVIEVLVTGVMVDEVILVPGVRVMGVMVEEVVLGVRVTGVRVGIADSTFFG